MLLALPGDFCDVVFYLIARVLIRTVNRLEAFVITLRRFKIEPEGANLRAVAGEQIGLVILTIDQLQSPARLLRLRRRNQIDHATGCLWTVTQLRCTLENLYRLHTRQRWKVIGLWCSVGSRRNEYPIFHQRNLRRTLCGSSANTDIGSQAVTIFFPNVGARYGFQQLVDVGGEFVADLQRVNECPGARNLSGGLTITNNRDFFQRLGFKLDCRIFDLVRRKNR